MQLLLVGQNTLTVEWIFPLLSGLVQYIISAHVLDMITRCHCKQLQYLSSAEDFFNRSLQYLL